MTDQPKWTPGRWVAKWSKYEEGNFIVQAGMPTNRVLAQFDGDGDGPDGQSLADAHLIAAAPDLYAALDGLLGLLDAGSLYEPQAYAARAALAKARGETK
jgi:hypothetical protein